MHLAPSPSTGPVVSRTVPDPGITNSTRSRRPRTVVLGTADPEVHVRLFEDAVAGMDKRILGIPDGRDAVVLGPDTPILLMVVEEYLVLTAEEAAKMLHIGRCKVCDLIRNHELRSVKIGGSWRIPRPAVEDYVSRLPPAQQCCSRGPLLRAPTLDPAAPVRAHSPAQRARARRVPGAGPA